MKSRKIIFTTVLSALVCFGLCQQVQSATDTPDPGPLSVSNTADGQLALPGATGTFNSAFGIYALLSNGAASFNTGVGAGALFSNTADENTATGAGALFSNTTGADNTANGTFALFSNTAGGNTAIGADALLFNTTGGTVETSVLGFDLGPNTAVGFGALENNVDASANTAVGYHALLSQVTGFAIAGDSHFSANTAVGFEALANVTGAAAGDNAANDAYGYQALGFLTDGNSNLAIGARAGFNLTTGDGNVYIGPFTSGPTSEFFVTRIGSLQSACFISGIVGTAPFADTVTIDPATGQLGDLPSSARFKKDIDPMDKTSEAIFSLRPVTFHYKKDQTNTPQFGLIAEEVAKVNPALIGVDKEGKPYTVAYHQINAMLLNEFLKEHKKVEELQVTVAQQQKGMEVLTAQLKEQAAQIQKVSAQLEASKPAPQVVNNP
jgi:hypothetical protein